MKDNKTNTILTIAAVSALTYMVMEMFKSKWENILRESAGESKFERSKSVKH